MVKIHHEPPNGKDGRERKPILVSLQEVAQMLGLSVRTVYRRSQEGLLPPIVKVGRSSRMVYQDVLDYVERITGNRTGGLTL